MKIINQTVVLLFLCLVAILNVQGQNEAVNIGGVFSNLSLEITSTKESFVRLEPIPIIFKLSNNTSQTISGHTTFRFDCNTVAIFVRNPAGLTQKIETLSSYRAHCVGKDGSIPAGARTQSTELLKLDLNRYFASPGTYGLQAVFRSRSGPDTVRSSWMTISVTDPQGANLAAYEFLKQGTDVSRAFNMHETDEQRTFFEAFLANYPDTSYAPYIQLNLAEHYLFVGDINKAKGKLEKLKASKGFVFASKVDELLKELETRQKFDN